MKAVYSIKITKDALKDWAKIKKVSSLKNNVEELVEILKTNPFASPPFVEKLKGVLEGAYSRRINKQHRLVYQVLEEKRIVKIISMWTHYE